MGVFFILVSSPSSTSSPSAAVAVLAPLPLVEVAGVFLGVALVLVGEAGAESPLASAIAASFLRMFEKAFAVDLGLVCPASLDSLMKSI